MRLVAPDGVEQNRAFATLAAQQLNMTFAEPFAAYSIMDGPETVGAVVLNNYDGHNVDLSGAGSGAFTPSVIRSLAAHVFGELKCARVTLKTRRSNKAVRKLLNRHFKFEAVLRLGYGDEDAFQFRMCRDECPWLERR